MGGRSLLHRGGGGRERPRGDGARAAGPARIVEEHGDRQALLVSHKATIRLLVSALLGFDPRAYRDRLDQSPASLNILDFKDATHARLSLFNDTSHYAPGASATPEMPHERLSKWWDRTRTPASGTFASRVPSPRRPLASRDATFGRGRR